MEIDLGFTSFTLTRPRFRRSAPTPVVEEPPVEDADTDVEYVDVEDKKGDLKPVETRAVSKAIHYNTTRNGDVFYEPDYNLNDLAAAIDTEAYFRISVDKIVGRIFKQGWSLTGKDMDAVQYIYKRLQQMSMATQCPTDDLLEDIARQLVTYGNAFVAKSRSKKASGGSVRRTFYGQLLQPVAGYEVLDATSIKIARKENGKVRRYRQEIPQSSARVHPEWPPENMIHFHYDRKRGLAYGTPFALPVLDDIRALRNIEQNVEILIFQYAIPLYHVLVGNDETPAQPNEVKEVKSDLNMMPQNGLLITPHRHKIEVLGAQGEAIKAEPYMEYFKKRVLAGLRMGATAVGEGDTSNRSTAGVIDKIVQEVAEVFQKRLKLFIDDSMFKELLAEGGFREVDTDGKPLVGLHFPPIDLDERIAKENHVMTLFQGNLISHDEARVSMGMEPMTREQWGDTHWELIDKPKSIIGSVDEPFLASGGQAGGVGKKGGDTVKQVARNAGIPAGALNKGRPENQHGRRTSPKTKKDGVEDAIGEEVTSDVVNLLDRLGYQQYLYTVTQTYNWTKDDLKIRAAMSETERDKEFASGIVTLSLGDFQRAAEEYVGRAYVAGVLDSGYDEDPAELGVVSLRDSILADYNRLVRNLASAAAKAIEEEDVSAVEAAFDVLQYRLDFITRTQLMKGYNLGFAKGSKALGYEDIAVEVHRDEDGECKEHPSTFHLDNAPNWDDLPPYHPNCGCYLKAN